MDERLQYIKERSLITPERFAEMMREVAEDTDVEARHHLADAIMCHILVKLGYEEGVELFLEMDKWYA